MTPKPKNLSVPHLHLYLRLFDLVINISEKLFRQVLTVVDASVHLYVLFLGHLVLHLRIEIFLITSNIVIS